MASRRSATLHPFAAVVRYRTRVVRSSGFAAELPDIEGLDVTPTLVRLSDVPGSSLHELDRQAREVGATASPLRRRSRTRSARGSLVLAATEAQRRSLVRRLRRRGPPLRDIGEAIESAHRNASRRTSRRLRGLHRSLTLGDRTRVMGIVNVTPDSFSDGGEYLEPERAVHRALHLIAEGADLVDLGAESTRPGSPPVPAPVQLARLRPVLSKLHAQVSVPISVDTRDPEVAQVALDSGADLINDVSGLRDPALRRVLARAGAPAILMHMRGTPETMQSNLVYADLIDEVYGGLARGAWTAIEDGVSADALLVDPGLGFGKSGEQNLTLLARADEFRSLGFPVAIGASRKAFLGRATGESDPGAREAASVAAAVLAANRGVEVVRAHDVLPTVQAVRLADAVRRGRFEPGGSAGRNRPARPSRSGSG